MDPYKIISVPEFQRLVRYKLLATVGWGLCVVLVLALVFALGELRAINRAMAEVRQLKAEVLEVQRQQEQVTASYVKAWQLQESTAATLIQWGEFAIEKKQLTQQNKNMVSVIPGRRNAFH
jgi:hypothetical protein